MYKIFTGTVSETTKEMFLSVELGGTSFCEDCGSQRCPSAPPRLLSGVRRRGQELNGQRRIDLGSVRRHPAGTEVNRQLCAPP